MLYRILQVISVVKVRNHDIDIATANVFFVKVLSCFLHMHLWAEEYEGKPSLLTLPHFNHYIIVADIELNEKVFNVLLSCLVGDAAKFNTPCDVLLSQETL